MPASVMLSSATSLVRSITTATVSMPAPTPATYSRATSTLHWLMAAGIGTCVATVQLARRTQDGEKKGQLMLVHKSAGLTLGGLLVPRVLLALAAKRPGPLPGSTVEHMAANLSHLALYFLMFALPGSGMAMGYFSGKGVPFWGLFTTPGKAEPDLKMAKGAHQNHLRFGLAMETLMPLHVSAAFLHAFRGHAIFSRINPFRG